MKTLTHIEKWFYINVLWKKIITEIVKKNRISLKRPFTKNFENSKNDICVCWHRREQHKYIESSNFTEWKCLVEWCECNCDGGWFYFLLKWKIKQTN